MMPAAQQESADAQTDAVTATTDAEMHGEDVKAATEMTRDDKDTTAAAAAADNMPDYSAGQPEEHDQTTEVETPACLLYTSPSPRDRTRSRMPSSA